MLCCVGESSRNEGFASPLQSRTQTPLHPSIPYPIPSHVAPLKSIERREPPHKHDIRHRHEPPEEEEEEEEESGPATHEAAGRGG